MLGGFAGVGTPVPLGEGGVEQDSLLKGGGFGTQRTWDRETGRRVPGGDANGDSGSEAEADEQGLYSGGLQSRVYLLR